MFNIHLSSMDSIKLNVFGSLETPKTVDFRWKWIAWMDESMCVFFLFFWSVYIPKMLSIFNLTRLIQFGIFGSFSFEICENNRTTFLEFSQFPRNQSSTVNKNQLNYIFDWKASAPNFPILPQHHHSANNQSFSWFHILKCTFPCVP